MPIVKEPFGATSDGIAVDRYHLVNQDGLHVCILTYGGIVQTLQAVDRHGKVADIVLGFDTLQPYLEEHPYFGAIVGRYANRIAHGRFTLEDKQYQLAVNNSAHHLHGGVRGFDKQIWRADIEEVSNACCLVLSYISGDGDEGYPGTLSVEVRYTWSDSNELRIDYTASTDAPTILNLTNHSYFNLAGFDLAGADLVEVQQHDILNHRVQLNADSYLLVDATLIPTGVQAVTGSCMDFRKQTAIGQNMDLSHPQLRNANGGYDHAWLLNTRDDTLDYLPLAALVNEPISGRSMKVYTTQPAIQFYTGNFLDGSLFGKNNMQYGKHAGFCLETQHYPDSPNHPEFPSTVLLPGAIYQQTTVYKFGIS